MWVLLVVLVGAQPLLGRMEQAYKRSEFEGVLDLANKRDDTSAWSVADQTRLHELIGLAHLFLEDRGNAEKEFLEVFRLKPSYEADKKRSPPSVVEFVDYVRIKSREPAPREPAPIVVAPQQVVTPTHPTPPPVQEAPKFNPLSLIPFGIGQLATGDYVAGTIFISCDVAFFASSLSLYLVRQSERTAGNEYLDKPRADAMQIAQNVLSGAFVAVVVIGFIDALALSPKRVAAKKQIMVVPTAGGLSVLGTF